MEYLKKLWQCLTSDPSQLSELEYWRYYFPLAALAMTLFMVVMIIALNIFG